MVAPRHSRLSPWTFGRGFYACVCTRGVSFDSFDSFAKAREPGSPPGWTHRREVGRGEKPRIEFVESRIGGLEEPKSLRNVGKSFECPPGREVGAPAKLIQMTPVRESLRASGCGGLPAHTRPAGGPSRERPPSHHTARALGGTRYTVLSLPARSLPPSLDSGALWPGLGFLHLGPPGSAPASGEAAAARKSLGWAV